MNKESDRTSRGARSRLIKAAFIVHLLPVLAVLFGSPGVRAGSATWNTSPASNDWNAAANWTPATVPNGPSDTATFGGGIPDYAGPGFVIEPAATLEITNSATAGLNVFTNYGQLIFSGSASSDDSDIYNKGGTISGGSGGVTQFKDSAKGGISGINNIGGTVSGALGGITQYFGSSVGGAGYVISAGGLVPGAGGGVTQFFNTSACPSQVIAESVAGGGAGGSIQFLDDSIGGPAELGVSGIGSVDISQHNPPGLTVVYLGGNGQVFLGANNLTVYSANTFFSGKIRDGGLGGGRGGSLTVIGLSTQTFTLEGPSMYTGGTTVNTSGTLSVTNHTGSATGSGPVSVNAGTLGGTGRIAGVVTLGTGNGGGTFLAPGISATAQGTLTCQKQLIFKADATYRYTLKSINATADKVVAKGVTIDGALFSMTDSGAATLATGTVFTVINNTAAAPIAGTFSNLADGSTLIVGSNTYKANYEGGSGNDLTLTVQ